MAIYNYTGTQMDSEGDLKARDYYCAFSLFETIGVVGDSYANGYNAETENGSGINHPDVSWPQVLARRNGVSVTNYAWGGMSTRSFITNTSYGLPKLVSDPPKGLYLLVLERNDYNIENGGETGYMGALTDITGNSLGSYPDTFYGNYATIIETIQAHAPNAKLVMMAGDYSTSYALATQYNAAVEDIAEHYGIPCIKQRDEWYFSSGSNSYYRTKVGGHPTTVGYCGMELTIERLFNKCVYDNFEYFKYYAGVPASSGSSSGSATITSWEELTASSTSSAGVLAKISSNAVRLGSESGYQFKVFELLGGKTYKLYGFGYDRATFYMAVLGESDLVASGTETAVAIANVECGTDVYPDGYTYHTVTITPERDCYAYVNYKSAQAEAKAWVGIVGSNSSSGGSSSGGGAAAYGKRGVHIHEGVYDCFREEGGTFIIRRFTRRGPNNLFQWSALLLGSVDPDTGVEVTSTIATFSTDIVGPISLFNSTLFSGQTSGMYTGGNHAVTVSGTDCATAEQHSLKCLVNGVGKSTDGVYYGDVCFVAENYLYFPQSVSGNTLTGATQAVTERREYFLGEQMKVRVRLYFDQAATVSTYYGMQAVTVGFTDIMFANNEYYAALANVSSAVSTLTKEERRIMMSASNGLHFDMELADMGLGSYSHNTGSSSMHAYLPVQTGNNKNQKVYYVLIPDNDAIAQGSYLTWEGTYSLYFE